MTPEEAPLAPAAGAAPLPDFPSRPATGDDLSARARELEDELARVRAEAAGGETVTLQVKKPHGAFTYAGVTVTDRPTKVPARMLAALLTAAGEAGVTLEEA